MNQPLFRVGDVFFFFFKQKTAYEIRKGDWSSDVCSSDLDRGGEYHAPQVLGIDGGCRSEERRVGKSVLPCVDLGGRRIIKKKKKKNLKKNMYNISIKNKTK